ncbi:MAG: helix-turn-helix domain-containing protein [Chloroflexi bacterium]|nr:helix-turn-helix domain-containing protein [Chloroflexota bacterium]
MKHRREALRLTQEELGLRLGYQEDTISRYEREDRFPKNSADGLIQALEIPTAYVEAVIAVIRRTKGVDTLPQAHLLSDAVPGEPARTAAGSGSGKWVTYARRDLLDAERAERLIGRDRLMESAAQCLADGKRVLIRGFGGIGKTALAAEIAHGYLIGHPDGAVMWLHVGDAGVRQAIQELARSLQMEREVSRAVSNLDAAELMREKLAQTPTLLIVLDDIWWSFEDFKWVVANVVPSTAALLVTSRYLYALRDGERIELDQHDYALEQGGLPVLAHYAAQPVEALLRDPAAAELCSFLGDLPLALEIAGQSMALGATAGDLLQSVVKTLDTLQYPADYGESEMARRRHASVTATLDSSLEQLDDAVMRRVFSGFGAAYTPVITRDLLARYLDLESSRVQAALDGLSRRSLVRLIEREGDVARYRVHDVAYRYLRERSAPNRAQQVKFTEACLRYVNDFARDVTALYAERVNFLHAASHAADVLKRPDIMIDILYRLTVDSAYLGAYGHDELLRTRLYEAIHAAEGLEEKQPEYVLMAHFLYGKLGDIEYLGGRLDEALAAYEASLRRARALEMKDREIILMGVTLRVYVDRRQFDVAGDIVREMQAKADALGNDFISMRALEYIGYHDGERVNYYKEIGDARYREALEAAEETWEKFYEFALKLDIQVSQIVALLNLAGGET